MVPVRDPPVVRPSDRVLGSAGIVDRAPVAVAQLTISCVRVRAGAHPRFPALATRPDGLAVSWAKLAHGEALNALVGIADILENPSLQPNGAERHLLNAVSHLARHEAETAVAKEQEDK